MLHKKQVAVISLVILLMLALYSLDIKSLIKSEENTKPNSEIDRKSSFVISLEIASERAKQTLNANLIQQITDLENALQRASAIEKLKLQKQLAQKWDDVNMPAPSAFYDELIADTENTYPSWIKVGDKFTNAYQASQDSVMQPALIQKAIIAFQNAQKLQPSSLDAKIGLGVAYVSGTPDPMKGVALLLDVVKQEPGNIKANMSLGLFSMKSGQYEKAVNRFKTVLSQVNKPDAWFYLATSYENIGKKDEAIASYIKTKELAADPGMSQFVDRKVNELKKVN